MMTRSEYEEKERNEENVDLREGNSVEELLLKEPLAVEHGVALNEGNGGVGATKGEETSEEAENEEAPVLAVADDARADIGFGRGGGEAWLRLRGGESSMGKRENQKEHSNESIEE